MIRSLSVIVAAILLSQPKMPRSTAQQYAQVVRDEAREHYFDPFTLVSMVHYESRWIASAHNGKCFGLAGICLSNYPYCRTNPKGPRCQAKRAELLDGRANLRIAADLITANRRFCRSKTGRAKFHHWLASYQGLNKPDGGIWCGQRKVRGRWRDVKQHWLTKRVIKRRGKLLNGR